MTAFGRRLEPTLVLAEVVADRLRAQLLQVRGRRLGAKTRIGPRVRIDRPWAIETGPHCRFEADVWLKLVGEPATVTIGAHTFVGRGVEIDVSGSVRLGSHVLVAPSVFMTDHAHEIAAGQLIDSQGCTQAPIVVEDDVWLGARCVILPGVRVGRGAVVGAGAVVTRDVPDGAVVAGVPARILRHRR